jgi:hypothetical protein
MSIMSTQISGTLQHVALLAHGFGQVIVLQIWV